MARQATQHQERLVVGCTPDQFIGVFPDHPVREPRKPTKGAVQGRHLRNHDRKIVFWRPEHQAISALEQSVGNMT
ncbi:hypothetical protein [Thiosulfatihalobacter marinus]|jgi:hypothetical protein|uniref:hypothetical protein n=1 Tax=Thiosulfatihalobacter marinus TaxID=2792481 RepID=UPI0018D6805E|nr:hypothetical protein [Thiosulfatihalobacter marinus]